MTIEIDAKGLFCPQPHLMANEAIKKHPDETIVIAVDNASPRDNIVRLAKQHKKSVDIVENNGVFTLTIS